MTRANRFQSDPVITVQVVKMAKKCLRIPPIKRIGGASVKKFTLPLVVFSACTLAASANAARPGSLTFTPQTVFEKNSSESGSAPKSKFSFKDSAGNEVSVPVIEEYRKDRIVHPMAKVDPRLDPRLARAASIADDRARAHSKSRCWRYVKEALLASGAVSSYPKTSLAKQAGDELVRDFGFKKLPIRDPYAAPVGSVLVYYKGRNRPGHVEIRTKTGFVSDFRSKSACKSALIGVYAKK